MTLSYCFPSNPPPKACAFGVPLAAPHWIQMISPSIWASVQDLANKQHHFFRTSKYSWVTINVPNQWAQTESYQKTGYSWVIIFMVYTTTLYTPHPVHVYARVHTSLLIYWAQLLLGLRGQAGGGIQPHYPDCVRMPVFQLLGSTFQFPVSIFWFPAFNFQILVSNFWLPVSNFRIPGPLFDFWKVLEWFFMDLASILWSIFEELHQFAIIC